ncbi:MAG TPA: bifunctional diguanylate cyclase/phosphodiesterase [Devosiaceae bacterium]|jgi:diguanylate cyclase (GGDEF)-like protein
MPSPRRKPAPHVLVAIAVLGMIVLGSSVYFGLNYAVEQAVIQDGDDKANHWSDYFLENMPDLDRLLVSGQLDPQQIEVIKAAEKLGDVFRFKLYDLKGGVVLTSDEARYEQEPAASRAHSENAEAVLKSRTSKIEVNDGRGQLNRPALYVEAYVPIAEADGTVHGVVEVYIDQTQTADIFRNTFAALALGLAIVAALAFGLPTLAFLFSTRQASEAKRRVEFLAHHDPMTGLINRSTFNERLEAGLRLHKGARAPTLVFLDVDAFKAVNDTYGHEAGDEFLKHVARCLSGLADPRDLVARPGGDEFTVALFERSPEEAVGFVEAAMQAVRQPITIRGKAIAGRLSAGISIWEPEATLADAMHKADIALYQAKIEGRNTYRQFSPTMEAGMLARRALEQLVREAAVTKNFELHFQPLLRADTKQCAGFEALLRLPDGKGGLVSPVEFIPVAEQIGLITEIGAWVIGEATRIAATWPEDIFIAVNLSVRQFADGKLVEHVQAALAESGLKAQRLELEVTESMLIDDPECVGSQLKQLRDLGISIAMDDFGTGYSSLGYLWQFGFDKLKIDRSFIAALDARDPRALEIVDTIIMLGHKLDMTVTAEGIETDYHASILAGLACDHFQGYLYGRPAPARDLAAYLLAGRHQAPPMTPPPQALSA